jgi:hypothetical protein
MLLVLCCQVLVVLLMWLLVLLYAVARLMRRHPLPPRSHKWGYPGANT